jgi:SAM-dependent methyltransferase
MSPAGAPLGLSVKELLQAWRGAVLADNAQVEALADRPRSEDFYAPVAEQFRADPRRQGEPSLEYLRSLVRPDETWLDLGAGGGRYSLAIALLAAKVYAVEPSEGMRRVLTSSAADAGITNIEILPERWPGPSACPVADRGLISQIGYDIAEIGPFLDQLEAHSRSCVAMLLERAPIGEFATLWQPVHGEERALLPGLRELNILLLAAGRLPEMRVFEARRPSFESLDAMQRAARRPLWVREGSEKDQRLRQAIERTAIRTDDGFVLSSGPRRLGVLTWRPGDSPLASA